MSVLPACEIKTYSNADDLPADAEEMFARQLADSREELPEDRSDRGLWHFLLVCAVTPDGKVLGGVHLDVGPINGAGPMARMKLAYLERTFVLPEHRRWGLGSLMLEKAIEVLTEDGCEYIRCSNNWDNSAERALLRRSGFALIDLDGDHDPEPCYLAVRPLQNLTR